MAKFRTHYDSLNVSRNAPTSVIKAAYKTLCQHHHPDKYAGGADEAIRIMKIINAAYAVLSDSKKRAEHDQWIDRQEREHATDEAQRIMKFVNKTYAQPAPTVSKPQAAGRLRYHVGNFASMASGYLSKKIRAVLYSMAVVCGIWAIIFFNAPDSTTGITSGLTDQELTKILKEAAHLLGQGQIKTALPLYLQLANEEGNADAQFQLGMIYFNGKDVIKDDFEAFRWFTKAAEQGHRDAQTKLAFMYALGKGVEQNYTPAIYLWYKAAEQGDVIAQYNLGVIYEKGQGVAKDDNLAFSWYTKAAAQGDARAQFILGGMYLNGMGVVKDKKKAAALYRQAAGKGVTEAANALRVLEK